MFNKSTWAKIFGVFGSILTFVGGTGALGKTWSPVALAVGGALTTGGIWHASNTSAGNPNGQNPRV